MDLTKILPLLCRALILKKYFIFFSDHPNLELGPSHRTNYKVNFSQVYPTNQGSHFSPQAGFLYSLDMPHAIPSRPFLPRDFHQFLSLCSCWDQPSWGSRGITAAAVGGLGQPQGSQNPASSSMPQHWFCSWALPPFTSKSFYFMFSFWGRIREDTACFRSNLFLSIQSLVSLLLLL